MAALPYLFHNQAFKAVSVRLTKRDVLNLDTIKTTLQRESATPTVAVSASTAIRAALALYAVSLYPLRGRLLPETVKATKNTYSDKTRKAKK